MWANVFSGNLPAGRPERSEGAITAFQVRPAGSSGATGASRPCEALIKYVYL